MSSEAYSTASELSSRTVFALAPSGVYTRPGRGDHGSKRALCVLKDEESELTPSKRAASCRAEDLSCEEATLFERLPDGSCTYSYEAESQFQKHAVSLCALPAWSADLREMIRQVYMAEQRNHPNPCYMERHGHFVQAAQFLEPSMRMVAVSWLVEVACEFSLQQDTLFLAANLLDRFLSLAKGIPRNHLQLTAVACMLIAAKHEETDHIPSVQDFTNIADHCFKNTDLLRMEFLILHTTKFKIMQPNAYTIYCLLRKALALSPHEAALAMYLTELAMLDYRMLRFWPSQVAAAAIFISQALLRMQADKGTPEAAAALEEIAGYHVLQLVECAHELRELQQAAFDAADMYNPLMAVKEKYRDVHWHCVSHDIPTQASAVTTLASAASRSSLAH